MNLDINLLSFLNKKSKSVAGARKRNLAINYVKNVTSIFVSIVKGYKFSKICNVNSDIKLRKYKKFRYKTNHNKINLKIKKNVIYVILKEQHKIQYLQAIILTVYAM